MPISTLKGTFSQSMDVKGRMSFPTKLREIIGEKFVITHGVDGCLFVYSLEDFERISEKFSKLPLGKAREIQRFFMAPAAEVEADKQGRILIPQNLREYASLEKEIIVAGIADRAEIWNKASWDSFNEAYDNDKFLETLDELDI